MVWRLASACGPGAEFVGVAYDPDVLDPVACDLEREHGDGGAVVLGYEAGLAVDGAFEECHAGGLAAGDVDPGAGDLVGAFDGVQEGDGEAAAVGGGGGGGVEQGDQGVDVLGFPGLLEGPDEAGLAAGRGAGGCAARMRRRAEEASWRQAAGVRPTMPAISAKG